MTDCIPDVQSGRPILPVATLSFELPEGCEVATLTLAPGLLREIPLAAPVEWGQIPCRPLDAPRPEVPRDPAIYAGANLYPSYERPTWRTDPQRNGTLLSLQIHPVRLDPAKNALWAAESVTVTVTFKPRSQPNSAQLSAALVTPQSVSPLSSEGPYTYLVIASSNLIENAPGPWNLQSLCAARARSGFTTNIVSTEWVQANYDGTNAAARIRAFVQDAYAKWGVQYLLLAGTFERIPVQKLYISFTDLFVTRTAEIPADALYFGCMDGTFDNNGNGRYGEQNDGPGGTDVDLTAEIMVGRFPVANAAELANMVRKTLRYEQATASDLSPVSHVAEKVDMGTTVYATGFMEELRNGSTAYGLASLGFETSPYAEAFDTARTLYDADGAIWASSHALALLNQNLHCINHLGHGDTNMCMKISLNLSDNRAALRALTNTMPYFVYSQACSPGAFDTADCFAEQLVTATNAAFAAVMNARDGWEYTDLIGGYSHRFHRCFWDVALRNTATRFGDINELSRRMNLAMLSTYSGNYWRWVYYELNLFGDPATPFAAAVNRTPPVIAHEPLVNTFDTQSLHRVTCTLAPIGIFDPDAISLVWRTDRQPGVLHTQTMTQVSGPLFESFLPPQPANTRIAYAIHALNHAACETCSPASGEHVFYVTDRLTLTIAGTPSNYGVPTPDYGAYACVSGIAVTASSASTVSLGEGTRAANHGFLGTGSLPLSGTNQTVTFQMGTSTLLEWVWQHEHRLVLESDIDGQLAQTFWAADGSDLPIPDAPGCVTLSNGTVYAFAEWQLDGLRSPAAPQHSAPAFGTLAMDGPHTLEARYLPADLDADTNGIPDWWEFQYYGIQGQDPTSDEDGDGYTLLDEFEDRTNPLLTNSFPSPPLITFAPFEEIQTHPGPFTLRATILDTHAVSNAAALWRRGAEPWQTTAMSPCSNNLFEAQFGAISAPGDYFEYQILASDPSGNTSRTDICRLDLVYPQADLSRFHDLSFVALPTQSMLGTYMDLHNTGNADLVWSTRFARVESILDPALSCWSRISLGQSWRASTNRFVSPPYSLYSKLVSGGMATSPAVRASITLPPLLIGPRASLSFNYWIHSEPYKSTSRTFDGGIVEYSLDNGTTFQQLNGPYTHTIYGWDYSPWTNGTPCLAGNGTEGWRTITFDFNKEYPSQNGFQGQNLILRFHYGGDNNTDNEGWYIDDVTVMPLQGMRNGFAQSVEPTYSGIISSSNFARIFWSNTPPSAEARDDNLTVYILSNDPVTPSSRFFWSMKIRDYPHVSDLHAAQSSAGDGRVLLSTDLADNDGEPIDIQLDWSTDNGNLWLAAAVTNVYAMSGTADVAAADGRLTNLLTASGSTRLTNRISAVWETLALANPISVSTQTLIRITATNGYFGACYTTPAFTVDNVPPDFPSGVLTASPHSSVGDYAFTTNLLALAWPAASDNPSSNLTYRLTDSTPAFPVYASTHLTTLTTAILALSNSLDTTHSFSVTAFDPAGNSSATLSLSLPILNALGDYDGDGIAVADEEVAGTSATDPADRFTVSIAPVRGKPGFLSVTWNSSEGRRYTVEETPTLQPPVWSPLPNCSEIAGTGAAITVDLPHGSPSHFFRLRVITSQ